MKKEFTILKHQRNNSTTILREKENNENKTLSLNKYNRDKNNDKFLQKSGNKNLYNTNSKPNNLYPLSCKNDKNNGNIVRKYIQKEMIRNSSLHNIKGESKN